MLNYLWGFMIIIGVVYGALTGRINEVGNGVLTSANEAVSLCLTMLGVMTFWTGLMEVCRCEGLLEQLSQKLAPVIHFLFPKIPKTHPAFEHITTNFIANILGLGWAATPAGLKAMEELANLEEERGNPYYQKELPSPHTRTASNEMCIFLILNISSLQLIPVNMIAYRSQYGSINPPAIVGPAIIATLVSTLVAIIFCKIMDKI